MSMSVVDEIRQRVDKRLEELRPLLDEYRELLAVREGLANSNLPSLERLLAGSSAASGTATRRRTGTRSARRGAGKAKKTRPQAGRAQQALEIIGAKPGITVKEVAAQMGINENYLYRLLPRMEKEGSLKRQGPGWAVK
jgi:transposase